MLEDKKIREAHFFYALALNEERKVNDDRDTFEHFLSAFLSASRSVLQYAHNEAVLGEGRVDRYGMKPPCRDRACFNTSRKSAMRTFTRSQSVQYGNLIYLLRIVSGWGRRLRYQGTWVGLRRYRTSTSSQIGPVRKEFSHCAWRAYVNFVDSYRMDRTVDS
jgi:hypothetical protein